MNPARQPLSWAILGRFLLGTVLIVEAAVGLFIVCEAINPKLGETAGKVVGLVTLFSIWHYAKSLSVRDGVGQTSQRRSALFWGGWAAVAVVAGVLLVALADRLESRDRQQASEKEQWQRDWQLEQRQARHAVEEWEAQRNAEERAKNSEFWRRFIERADHERRTGRSQGTSEDGSRIARELMLEEQNRTSR